MTLDPIGDYDRVSKIKSTIKPQEISSFTPQPSIRDRRIGEINRYFARFVTHQSSSDIVEVSKATYNKLKRYNLYQVIRIRWKISGLLEDEYGLPNINTPVRLYTGVLTANRLSVEFAEDEMPGIGQYITNYQRFWEPNEPDRNK